MGDNNKTKLMVTVLQFFSEKYFFHQSFLMIADVFIEVKICNHTIVKKEVFIGLVVVRHYIVYFFDFKAKALF